MRRGIQKTAAYLHAVLFLAIIVHTVFGIAWEEEQEAAQYFYWLSFCIIIPVAVTGEAAARCKGFLGYGLFSLASFAGMEWLVRFIGIQLMEPGMLTGFCVFLGVEAVWVVADRLLGRLDKAKQQKECVYGRDTAVKQRTFEKPYWGILAVFFAAYAAGLLIRNAALCNEALGSAILYFFLCASYHFVAGTENYLGLNHRVGNMPSKRIYGINGVILVVFLLAAAVPAAAAVGTAGLRRYLVWEKLDIQVEQQPAEWAPSRLEADGAFDIDMYFPDEEGAQPEPPEWLDDLAYVVAAAALFGGVILLIQEIRRLLARFGEGRDENGDLVEELKEPEQEELPVKRARRGKEPSTERERIRRRYRRTIRRHRKETPAAHETPLEMEQAARIADTPEGRELHELYEKARYGR